MDFVEQLGATVGSSIDSFANRAAEYRRLAAKTNDEWLRETCLRLAAQYEQMALAPSESQSAALADINLDQLRSIAVKHS